ncbi:hypothetical protein C0J52_13492, partial [Blattella germanica]
AGHVILIPKTEPIKLLFTRTQHPAQHWVKITLKTYNSTKAYSEAWIRKQGDEHQRLVAVTVGKENIEKDILSS